MGLELQQATLLSCPLRLARGKGVRLVTASPKQWMLAEDELLRMAWVEEEVGGRIWVLWSLEQEYAEPIGYFGKWR